MLDMRIKIPELMERAKIGSAYMLSIKSGRRISMTNAHHLVEMQGATSRVDFETLDVLCEVFGVGPDKILTNDPPPPRVEKPKRKRKAA